MTHAPRISRRRTGRFWRVPVSLVVLLALCLSLTVEAQAQDPICIPEAYGVPALNGPPVWTDALGNGNGSIDQPNENDRLDDARWRGTFAEGHPVSSVANTLGEQVVFRSLQKTESGTPYLYLSWVVKVAPDMDPNGATIHVGFEQGGGDAYILQFDRDNASATTTGSPMHSSADVEFSSVRTSSDNGMTWSSPASPGGWERSEVALRTWVAEYGDPSPFQVSGQHSAMGNMSAVGTWAIQMRIPFDPSGASGPTASPPFIPIDPSSEFRMWYSLFVPVTQGPQITQVAQYTMLDAPGITEDTSGPFPDKDFPEVSTWPRVKFASHSTASGCATTGVSLARSDVGTTNSPPNQMEFNSPNTFFAQPTNGTANPINANGIRATFRLGNWGSQADWNNVGAGNPVWSEIPGGVNVDNSGTIAAGTKAGAGNDIRFDWTMSNQEKCQFQSYRSANPGTCSGIPLQGVAKRSHQCLLVELDGPGLTFLNQSVYRNMDFVGASMFERAAEISVVGVNEEMEPDRDGDDARMVYIFEEKRNLLLNERESVSPEEVEDAPRGIFGKPGDPVRIVSEEELVEEQRRTEVKLSPQDLREVDLLGTLDTNLPTYRIHVYRSTEMVVQDDPESRKIEILTPQSTFGYYLEHEGELQGWRTGFDGENVKQIAPRLYQARVPIDGQIEVKNVVQAVEEGEEPINDGDEIDQLLVKVAEEGGQDEPADTTGTGDGSTSCPPDSSDGTGMILFGVVLMGGVLVARRRWTNRADTA